MQFFWRKEMKIKKFYFSWITNLGVVPRFLSEAFLRLPADFFLLALRFFVTRVFETISELLRDFKTFNKIKYLPIWLLSVNCATAEVLRNPQHIIISRGEHREISVPRLEKFTVGNNDTLSHKLFKVRSILLIKGKKIGYSEIVIWKKGSIKEIYRVYVLSKKQHLKLLHLVQALEGLGLNTELKGPLVRVSGVIASLHEYKYILRLNKEWKDKIHFEVRLSKKLRNLVIGRVYHAILSEFIDDIACRAEGIKIFCHYSESQPPSPSIRKHLQNSYGVKFISLNRNIKSKNYRLRLKLIQIEKLDGEEISLGLDRLSGSLDELFNSGVEGIIRKNKLLLSRRQVKISTLAEPQSIMRLNSPLAIQVGSQIPIKTKNDLAGLSTTEWKFVGLNIKVIAERIGDNFKIKYTTEFSRPGEGGSLTGSKEISSAIVPLGKAVELFQITFQTSGENNSRLPWLSKIPLLGKIFESNSKQAIYKNISGVVILEDVSEPI